MSVALLQTHGASLTIATTQLTALTGLVRPQHGGTHVELLQAVDGVLSIQQLVGQVHNFLLHRLFVSLNLS